MEGRVATTSFGSINPRRKMMDGLFRFLCLAAVILALATLVFLLWSILKDGVGRVSAEFLNSFGSRKPEEAGIKAGIYGTLWVIALTALIAVPVSVAAAVYLVEFTSQKNRISSFIQVNISNLAGVPSIVYGLLGLAVFVRYFALDRSVLAAALTMSLLIMPMIIVVSQEAIKMVPQTLREASLAVGATKWQTVSRQVLPRAMPGIITGVILSVSRAMGETAPLIVVGALAVTYDTPSSVTSKFTVLPMQVYDWASRPQAGFQETAAAGIVVLMTVLILLNSVAIVIRARSQRKRL